MKRLFCIFISIILLFSLAACAVEDSRVESGLFFLDNNFKTDKTPYIAIYGDSDKAYISPGSALSFEENGTYKIEGEQLIISAPYTTYTFDINDSQTLVLTEITGDDYFKFEPGMVFAYGQGQILGD